MKVLRTVIEEHNISYEEISSIARKKENLLPVSIFDDNLSSLEAICKYLKEELNLSYHEIALLLNRDDRTIWSTYNNAIKKKHDKFKIKKFDLTIPISILKNRRLSVLENLVRYMKENLGLRYCEIANLLKRDDRTIWTTYKRIKIKNG